MNGVVIRRCAWHRQNFGWTLIKAIDCWWPFWPVLFSDGICDVCLGRMRRKAGPAPLGRAVEILKCLARPRPGRG